MQNYTILGFKQVIQHRLERKQLSLLVTLDFYVRTKKRVLKREICERAAIVPQSLTRSIKRLNKYGFINHFNYDDVNKKVVSSFKLYQNKQLHVQIPTNLLRIGALNNSYIAVLGYLKAFPNGEWNGSCYKLHQKINAWFVKHHIRYELSLTTIYKAINVLKALKLINKVEFKQFKNKNWIWTIKINVNLTIMKKLLPINEIVKILQQLTIKPFIANLIAIENQEIWTILD